MDEDLRALRRYLKEINTTGLRQLCHEAGFTDEETDIFAMCYSEGRSEQYIADKYYLGIDALHNTKMRLLSRLLYCYQLRIRSGAQARNILCMITW